MMHPKPCQCGGDAKMIEMGLDFSETYHVACLECGMRTSTFQHPSYAIRSWDNRPVEEALMNEVKSLQEEVDLLKHPQVIAMDECPEIDPRILYLVARQKWGVGAQLVQLIEECAELIKATSKYINGRTGKDDLVDELADVSIMVAQIITMEELEQAVEDQMAYKLERLKKRLEE